MTAEWKTISALIERRYKAAATIEMKPDRKLRVGVTIHIRDGQQSIWENGIFQNCVFLVQLLNLSHEVERAVLVNGSGAREVHPSMMFDQVGVEMIDLQSALETLDVVVEMSSQVPEDWLEKFRARGGRIAWMRCGNDLVIDIERAMNNLPHAGLCSAKIYDAVWTLPEYAHTCVDYFAITTRAPVKIVPHLWTPEFFDKSIATLPQGVRFGYQPGKPRWRICCFEPNMCMVKTSITPMLVCEEAYRKTPARFESIRVCNTLKSKENPAFARFARYLDIVNHGIASFEGRFAVYEYMAHFGDCIVSHHWENGQNYLYYEALHGGYPLIHNSEFIRDLGYFYPDFDCQAGGDALIRAFENHDANLAEYRKKSSEFLKTLDIRHPPNIEAYTAELVALFAATPHRPRSKKNANKTNFETVADQKPPESGTAARRLDGIYVINLDRRPDRLQRFSKNHPDLAGRFKRFAACDGKTLQLTPALSRLFAPNNFNWHKAKMGCAMSHLALWKNLSQRPGESWLIMEDDARLSPGWESAVELALKGSSLPEDWEVLFLGGVLPRHRETFEKNVEQLGGGIARVRPDCVLGNNPPGYFHFCAYAYLLSHRGALRLLDLVKQGGGIWMQADFLLACSKPGLDRKIFFLHPLRAESFQDSEQGFAQPYGEGEEQSAIIDSDIWKQMECFLPEQVASALNQSPEKDFNQALSTVVKSDTNVSAQKMGQLKLKRPDEIGEWPQGSASLETAIALCADSAYFAYSSVVILTLIENGKCAEYPIFLFAEEFHEEDIQRFRSLALMVGCRITLVPLGEHALKELPPCGHMSRATYLRLLIPSILQDFKKILYLDSDLLVLNDLRGLLETDISAQPAGAVRDLIGEKCCKIDFFKSSGKHYFNAGVLLINTEEWNQQKISEKVIEIARNDSERARLSAFADQCLLNYIISGNFFELGQKYNLPTFEPRNCSPAFLRMAPTPSLDDLKYSKILHFTGHCKPWMPESSLEQIWTLYKSFADRSPWSGQISVKKSPRLLSQNGRPKKP